MKLNTLRYSEHLSSPQEWTLDGFAVKKRTLVVGKNATGKTRTLNVIGALAKHISGVLAPGVSANYEADFSHGAQQYKYFLRYADQQVSYERLEVDGVVRLSRGSDGAGTIFAEQVNGGMDIQFQAPTFLLAIAVRRDDLQHSFIAPLHDWASAVRHYQFGSSLGREHLAIVVPGAPSADERDQNAVVGIFRGAVKDFPNVFVPRLIADLATLDYHVRNIEVGVPVSVKFTINGPGPEPLALQLRETSLPGITDQFSMSQGMFRVLALLIHINVAQLRKTATCLLIDDIGEGLDFDRSCRLIDLLRKKSDESDMQIIMSTNDRFIMNAIPFEEWSVLQRKGAHVKVLNFENSRHMFDDFRFTGLSNFSFLEMDIVNEDGAGEA